MTTRLQVAATFISASQLTKVQIAIMGLRECKDDQKSEGSFTPLIQCPHTFKWLLNEWSLTKGYLHFSRSNGSTFANSVIVMSLLNVTTMNNEKLM